MNITLKRDSPVPLYHQIAEAIRNAIAVGTLVPGAGLPTIRHAAERWDVNLHTVRKAYGELAREGLLEVARSGTRVTPIEHRSGDPPSLDRLVETFVRQGAERFGLSQIQLGQLLLKRAAAAQPVPVHFLECSHEQAAGHCEEIRAAWRVDAEPLVLDAVDELPDGILISTYFHYNDIRQRWPDRIDEVRFVAIAPDPALSRTLPPSPPDSAPRRLLVCELEEPKAVNITADLSVLLPADRYELHPRVLLSPSSLPRCEPGDAVLVSPRVWGAMEEGDREDVVLIRYRLRSYELKALGSSFGWRTRAEGEVA